MPDKSIGRFGWKAAFNVTLMRTARIIALIQFCLLLQLLAFVGPVHAEKLKVGVIIPLTGPASGNTRFGNDGIEFARSHAEIESSLEIFIEDYGSEPARAVSAYKKLAHVNRVHAFLVFGSPAAMALGKLVERDKNVLLAIASAQNLTKASGNSFRLINSAQEDSKFIAEQWFIDNGKSQTAAIVHVADDYGESYLRGLRGTLPGPVVEKLSVAEFLPNEVDFKSTINLLRSKKPDIVVLAAFAPPVGMFLRQSRELGFKSKFICPLACYNPDLFTIGQGGEEDLVIPTPANPSDQALVEAFDRRFHYEGNFMSWGFYDALLILTELSNSCSSTSDVGICLKEKLRRPEGFAATRGKLVFDDKGETRFGVVVNRASGGKFIPDEG